MPNYFNIPQTGPYAPQQQEILRRQKMAQLLQQQAMQPIEAPPTPSGGFAAPISPLQVAAKVFQGYAGGNENQQVATQQKQLADQMQAERQQALAKALQQAGGSPQPAPELGGGPAMPPDPVRGLAALGQSQDPSVMAQYAPIFNMQQQQMLAQQKMQESQRELGMRQAEAQRAEQVRLGEGQRREQSEQQFRREQATQAQGVQREIAQLRTDATREKSPPGYRPTAEGNLQAIPGGPADLKLQGALNIDTSMLNNSVASMDRLGSEANALLHSPGLSKSTGIMSVVPGIGGLASIPGSDAANFKARLETLKSQVGFSVLQEMRNNSKTGGALGQVSDRENQLLQQNLAALDRAQSEPEFRAALQRIIKYTEDAKDRFRVAYNLKHGGGGQNTGGLTPQEQQELDQLRKRFGR